MGGWVMCALWDACSSDLPHFSGIPATFRPAGRRAGARLDWAGLWSVRGRAASKLACQAVDRFNLFDGERHRRTGWRGIGH